MSLLQAALEKLFKLLKGRDRISIKMKVGNGLELFCFSLVVSYCCQFAEWKDISSVEPGPFARKLGVPRLASWYDVKQL